MTDSKLRSFFGHPNFKLIIFWIIVLSLLGVGVRILKVLDAGVRVSILEILGVGVGS